MATRPVAVADDLVATASSSTENGAKNASGTWSAGAVGTDSYARLTLEGAVVVHRASCTFTFSGSDKSSGASVTETEEVTLTAATTQLQKGLQGVLRDGDGVTSANGNRLEVQAAGSLRSD